MEFEPNYLLAFLLGALVAILAIAAFVRLWLRQVRQRGRGMIRVARREAQAEASEIKSQALLELEKERAEARRKIGEERLSLQHRENAFTEQERGLQRRLDQLERDEKRLAELRKNLERSDAAAANLGTLYRRRLRGLTDLTDEEAREALKAEVRRESEAELREIRQEILGRGEEKVRREAQRMLVDAMQRMSTSTASALGATLVKLPGEEMKGRIIGREGRNIRAFEAATGVTLMIDETPDTVLISSFDPVRREAARIALEGLIEDGRIHPSSIEDFVARAQEEMENNVIAIGESALLKLRLSGVHPEIVRVVGKLNYRLSNNQNTLEHSLEVAFFCSLLASELGLDPILAKRCGLFHDLGKAVEYEHEGSHAGSAARMLRRHGEDDRVVNAVEASHGEVAPASAYAALLQVADSASAARPGARSDSLDGYIQRVRALEDLAHGFEGVRDAYAVQAGREIRVIVEPDEVDELAARQLARRIRQRIEEEMHYPGSIKVTLIREQRFSESAK